MVRDPQRIRCGCNQRHLRRRFRAQLMIDSERFESQSETPGDPRRGGQQSHAVGASRNGQQNPSFSGDQPAQSAAQTVFNQLNYLTILRFHALWFSA